MQSVGAIGCPQVTVLQQFLRSKLPEDHAGAVDLHVTSCAPCQEVLDSLVEQVGASSEIERLLQKKGDVLFDSWPASLGGYRILGKLGQGAYGVVYHAYDDSLQRSVAIKKPHDWVVEAAGGLEMYLKEARALARLDHPHIVSVYEAKADGAGSCYLVSQYVAGRTLEARLAEGRMELKQAAALVAAIADALQHAHERGLVHRDVKPANILLDEQERPFLADFGLAIREEEIGRGPGLLGTPAYMSPEQARGDGHRVDGRSDIFSLGVVLYKSLTGRRPFLAESVDTLLHLVVHFDAPSVRQKDRNVPRELERICAQALARNLADRYRSASDMAEDLNSWLTRAAPRPRHERRLAGPRPIARQENDPRFLTTARQSEEHGRDVAGLPSLNGARTIGGFQLRTRLRGGGMGVVYRAWEPSAQREVALKCLSPDSELAQRRFATEIRALGTVEHPNLVRVYTSGLDVGRFYFAMEMIDGAPLGELLRHLPHTAAALDEEGWRETLVRAADATRAAERPLHGEGEDETTPLGGAKAPQDPIETAVEDVAADAPYRSAGYVRRVAALLFDVAEATQALHEKGVIHRDIKPENIFLTRDGQRAVLMDLGIAKLTRDEDGRVTRTRQFVGSLRYASPEQVIDSSVVDHRTDVYSLGATLWELLTARPIYGIDEGISDSQAMLRIEVEEPAPARKFNPAVPADLQAIVQKCLEKNPERRYASASELAADLRAWLEDRPVAARPVGPIARWLRRVRRRPLAPALTLSVVVLAIALLAALVPWPAPRSREVRIGIKPWVGFSPLVVASELELCEDLDLTLVPLRNTTDARQRIVSRELDLAPFLLDSLALARGTRTPAQIVLQLDVSLTADALVAGEGIRTFEDLKGKRIAYMHHEAPHFLLLSLCDKYGLSVEEFEHKKTETAKEAVDVFLAGDADAVVSYEPFLQAALAQPGAVRLASAADDPGAIVDILVAREDYLQSDRDRVEKVIAAWLKALDLLERGDPEALRVARRFLGAPGEPISVEEYREMAQGMRYSGVEENLRFFRRDAQGQSQFHRLMDTAQRRWEAHQQLSRWTNPADADASYVFLEMYRPKSNQSLVGRRP